MAKSKRNLSRKRRTNKKKRVVRKIRGGVVNETVESFKNIYDPEWKKERTTLTKMEEEFYNKQIEGHYKNVLIDGDEKTGDYVFKDVGNKAFGTLGIPDNRKLLSVPEMNSRKEHTISTLPNINTKDIIDLYNYLQTQIHERRDKAKQAVNAEQVESTQER
jgi:hypothetical protein